MDGTDWAGLGTHVRIVGWPDNCGSARNLGFLSITLPTLETLQQAGLDGSDLMTDEHGLTRANFKTPKAAAIAGILFCILFMAVLLAPGCRWPTDPLEAGEPLSERASAGRRFRGQTLPFCRFI